MCFSRPFHLLVAGLFLFQTVLPVNLLSAAPATERPAQPAEKQDVPDSSLPLETVILAELAGKMHAPLRELHLRYPEQSALWHALQVSLPDGDPRKQLLARQAGTTGALISGLVSYSDRFEELHRELVDRMTGQEDLSAAEVDNALARLYTIVQLQEKISSYELLAQTHFLDIHLLARTINANRTQQGILDKIADFETFRKEQIKQFLIARESFENVRKGFAFLTRSAEERRFAPLKEQIVTYRDLVDRFAARQHEASAEAQADLFARLGQITVNRIRELQAVLAVLTEGRDGVSWPILFTPGAQPDPADAADQGFSPQRLLSVLRDMRTAFIELADILQERNRLLLASEFLQRDDMLWLTVQIELEDLRLARLSEIFERTDEQVAHGNADAYQQSMIHWEEFGLLKEDILSLEGVILNELSGYGDNEELTGDPSWQTVMGLLHRQNRWRLEWSAVAASFQQVIDDFKTFQTRLLDDKLAAIETIRADVKRLQARSADKDKPIAQFYALVDESLAELAAATDNNRDLKSQAQQQDREDPLFGHFFGIRSERFWHDFKHMGIALWDHEQLTGNLARIRAHLLAVNSAGADDNRQAMLVLQLAEQFGVIDHLEYDGAGCTVHLRSATRAMLLEGCGGEAVPVLRVAGLDRTSPRPLTGGAIIRSLLCVVPPAHAGAYEQFTGWSGNVFNQMKKNWVNYAVTGVVLAGALVAAPVVAAAGATAATVATVTAVATTTALGAKGAFYAQASADIALGTSRHAINEMDFTGNETFTKKNFNTALDVMETTYNVAKVAEGVKNLVSPGQSVEELAEQVNKARQATQAEQLTHLQRMGELQQTADQVRRQIKAAEEAGDAYRDARKLTDLMRDRRHLVTLERAIEDLGESVADIGQKGARTIERIKNARPTEFVSNVSRLGQRIVEGTGLPSSLSDSAEGVKNLTKDSDGDGTPDAQDLCPGDPLKTSPGVCGCNKSDQDSDGDGTPDCKQSGSNITPPPDEDQDEGGPPGEDPPGEDPPGEEPPDEVPPGEEPPGETPPDETPPGEEPPGDGEPGDGSAAGDTAEGATDNQDGEEPDTVDTLRDADNEIVDPNGATTGTPVTPFPDTTVGGPPGAWTPYATHTTGAERQGAASTDNALSQLNADRQRMETVYQSGQTENQRQSAESMAQIDRQRSTQMVDAIVGGLTSGVAQGVGTLGERIGQGAGTRIAQDTGLVDRHPKPPTPGQGGEGHCHSDSDCPAGSTCDGASETCVGQDTTARTYSGSWGGTATCTANYGGRGTGSCPWKGSIQLTLTPEGGVSGSVTGGAMFNFDDDGQFTSCGGYNEGSKVSGSHSNGSLSASTSGGSRIVGSYTDSSISGTTSKAGVQGLAGGRTMNCRASGSISLSR
jgi:uncharacterized protein YoxC